MYSLSRFGICGAVLTFSLTSALFASDGNPFTNPTDFSVSDCTIALGESSCLPVVNVKGYPKRVLNVKYKNTDAKYIDSLVNGTTGEVFAMMTTLTQSDYDGASYVQDMADMKNAGFVQSKRNNLGVLGTYAGITYGKNTLQVFDESGNSVGTTFASAKCAPGTIWTVFPSPSGYHEYEKRGQSYCLPPFSDTPAGATTQERKLSTGYTDRNMDPEYGKVFGYCEPGYEWKAKNTYTVSGKTYQYYSCQPKIDSVNASEVTFNIQSCTINANEKSCNGKVIINSKVDSFLSVYRYDTFNTNSINGFSFLFSKSNFSTDNYDYISTRSGYEQKSMIFGYGENTLELRSLSHRKSNIPGGDKIVYLQGPSTPDTITGTLIKTVKVNISCASGSTWVPEKKYCLSNDMAKGLYTDIGTQFFQSILIDGKEVKSTKSATMTYTNNSSLKISGKLDFNQSAKDYRNDTTNYTYPDQRKALDEGKVSIRITKETIDSGNPNQQYNYISIPVKEDGTWDIKNTTTTKSYIDKMFPMSDEYVLRFYIFVDGSLLSTVNRLDTLTGLIHVNVKITKDIPSGSTLPADATPVPITGPISVASGATIPARTNTTSTDTDSAIVVIRDTLSPDTSSLDAASKARIDKIIARVEKRVRAMIVENALKYLDSSIARIKALPNKNAKAKLIDTYTIEKLEDLRDTIAETETDYIGLIDTSLSDK